MKKHLSRAILFGVLSCMIQLSSSLAEARQPVPNFADFDRRARAGENLSVVFFGGSLTWGANASNPQLTSYRALTGQKLASHYPRAHFTFWDAAIGGTGSQLGAFRLERDVLRHKADLVFLDFTVNDTPYELSLDRLASYEALVRRLTAAHVPLISVRFPSWGDFQRNTKPRPLDGAHQRIAKYYGVPVADVVAAMRDKAQGKSTLPDRWWPSQYDKTHPGDLGYAAYAAAVWSAYLQAVRDKAKPHLPARMLHAATYMNVARVKLSGLGALPAGWIVSRPNRTSAWYDALMSRWLDDEVVAAPGAAPIKMRFKGQTVLLFGEATMTSGKYRVLIDGKPALGSGNADGVFNASSAGAGGNTHHTSVVATHLDPHMEHALEIVPLLEAGQELRIESLCIAGKDGAESSPSK